MVDTLLYHGADIHVTDNEVKLLLACTAPLQVCTADDNAVMLRKVCAMFQINIVRWPCVHWHRTRLMEFHTGQLLGLTASAVVHVQHGSDCLPTILVNQATASWLSTHNCEASCPALSVSVMTPQAHCGFG